MLILFVIVDARLLGVTFTQLTFGVSSHEYDRLFYNIWWRQRDQMIESSFTIQAYLVRVIKSNEYCSTYLHFFLTCFYSSFSEYDFRKLSMSQIYQHFTREFFVQNSIAKNYKAKMSQEKSVWFDFIQKRRA
jgi:hypothetical protein